MTEEKEERVGVKGGVCAVRVLERETAESLPSNISDNAYKHLVPSASLKETARLSPARQGTAASTHSCKARQSTACWRSPAGQQTCRPAARCQRTGRRRQGSAGAVAFYGRIGFGGAREEEGIKICSDCLMTNHLVPVC